MARCKICRAAKQGRRSFYEYLQDVLCIFPLFFFVRPSFATQVFSQTGSSASSLMRTVNSENIFFLGRKYLKRHGERFEIRAEIVDQKPYFDLVIALSSSSRFFWVHSTHRIDGVTY